jgi:hypothetical protein
MPIWAESAGAAVVLIVAGLLYIRFRWHRSPHAYRAMLVLAGCYFVAGGLVSAWIMHLTARSRSAAVGAPSPMVASTPSTTIGPPFGTPALAFDPAHAALPNSKLTPGDMLAATTAADVCTPG